MWNLELLRMKNKHKSTRSLKNASFIVIDFATYLHLIFYYFLNDCFKTFFYKMTTSHLSVDSLSSVPHFNSP